MKLHKNFLFYLFAAAVALLCFFAMPGTTVTASATYDVPVVIASYEYPASEHNYASNEYDVQTFSKPGASRLSITFSSKTCVETGYDYIYLYDSYGQLARTYTGSAAAGIILTVYGDSFTIVLVSDGNVEDYGYSFSSIVAYMPVSRALSFTPNSAGNGYIVSDCDEGTYGEMAIPSTYNGKPVTGIGEQAFFSCDRLTSITVPKSVTSIEGDAFAYCDDLTILRVKEGNPVYHSAGNCIIETDSKTLIAGCNTSQIPSDGSVTSIGYMALSYRTGLTSITIPDSVTSIDVGAFVFCTGLNNITIPNSVTNIEEMAFYGCTGLKSITIPNSVTAIGTQTFDGCTSLTSITIPASVTSIGESAFSGCTGLTSITIPKSVASIGKSVFSGCSSLTSIRVEQGNAVYRSAGNCLIETASKTLIAGCKNSKIPTDGSVTKIGDCAFSGCTGLTSITIPGSVTSIGYGAFGSCIGLKSITISNGVTSIGDWAFSGCTGLTSITIPGSVTSIGNSVFDDCPQLKYNVYENAKYLGNSSNPYVVLIQANSNEITSCKIHAKTKIIGSRAFNACENLTGIIIPTCVTSIGNGAFNYCTGLTSITIPKSVTSIADGAITWCSSLTTLQVEKGNPVYHSAGNCIIETGSKKLIAGCNTSQIPSDGSVAAISDYAFCGCQDLTDITIPEGVTHIGWQTLSFCNSLTSIILPDSVTSIGDAAFYGSDSLTSIAIPNSVTSISWEAFCGCVGLETVIYCGTQEQWDAIEIGYLNEPLTDATLQFHSYENDVCTLCGYRDIGRYLTFTLNDTGDSYTISACDQSISGALVIPSAHKGLPVTGIGGEAFAGCTGLTSIIIPDSVTAIGGGAFGECTGLTSVTFGKGITRIECWAFYRCYSLTDIVIPEGVTSIDIWAFAECTSLENVTIPSTVSHIGYSAFSGCEALQGVYISDMEAWLKIHIEFAAVIGPDSPLHYAGNLYLNGKLVTKVVIPDSITAIDNQAFGGCTSLTEVIIPNGVTSIGNAAFHDCVNLTSVAIGKDVTNIGSATFYGCDNLTTVTYCGTQAQWDAIAIDDWRNDALHNATLQLHQTEDDTCVLCDPSKRRVAGDIDGDEVVTQNDVVYLLLHSMFGEMAYPLNDADPDIDGNGVADQNDVVYLLLHTMFGEAFYPLK